MLVRHGNVRPSADRAAGARWAPGEGAHGQYARARGRPCTSGGSVDPDADKARDGSIVKYGDQRRNARGADRRPILPIDPPDVHSGPGKTL